MASTLIDYLFAGSDSCKFMYRKYFYSCLEMLIFRNIQIFNVKIEILIILFQLRSWLEVFLHIYYKLKFVDVQKFNYLVNFILL